MTSLTVSLWHRVPLLFLLSAPGAINVLADEKSYIRSFHFRKAEVLKVKGKANICSEALQPCNEGRVGRAYTIGSRTTPVLAFSPLEPITSNTTISAFVLPCPLTVVRDNFSLVPFRPSLSSSAVEQRVLVLPESKQG